MFMPFGGIGEAIILLSLGMGYLVCFLAHKTEKNLKMVGYIIGIFIIVISTILFVRILALSLQMNKRMGMLKSPPQMAPLQPQQ